MKLLPLRSLYFFAFCVYGVVLPFLPLVLRSRGLSDAEISLNSGALGAAALIAPLVLAHFADRHWSLRSLLRAELCLAGLISLGWLSSTNIWTLFCITLAFFACYVPALGMLDAYTLRTLGTDGRSKFQSIRIWGSLGFLAPGLLGALLNPQDELLGSFVVCITIGAVLGALVLAQSILPYEQQAAGTGLPSVAAFKAAFRAPLWKMIWPAALACLGMAIYYSFYPLFLRRLGLSPGQMGLVYNLGVVSEILLMPFTGWLIGRLGARRLIGIAILSVLIRTSALAFSDSLWTAVLTQVLHAPIVVGFFVTLPIVMQEAADDSYRYSLQNLFVMIFMGLVRIAGPWLAGSLILLTEASGLHALQQAYLLGAAFSMFGLVLYLATSTTRAHGSTQRSEQRS